MAKDPALLWYFNDWMGGTATLSRHLKGCYMDLLSVQFNNGPLSLEEIKTVLGSDFGSSWPALQKKFKFENGCYFNERLQYEKDRRSSFSQRQSNKANKRWAHAEGMPIENENRNENENINKSNYEIYGELRKVLLTAEEYGKLVERFGEDATQYLISELDTGIASKGYKYKSHYATLLNWARRKYQEQQKQKLPAKTRTIA